MTSLTNIVSTGIVLEVLTRDNYLNWSTLVKNYLIGKNLWDGIVEGNIHDDLKNDPTWKSNNSQALHAIQLSCGDQTLRQIRNCNTANEAWNHLKAVFSEDLKADIEQGLLQEHVQTDLDLLHSAVKKGLWKDACLIIDRGEDIISKKSASKGWTALHVAVDAGQEEIIKELVKMGALLTEKDREGYTPLALAAKSTDDTKIARWMVNKGGDELLSIKIKSDHEIGDIPVVLAAISGHKEMTRFLFSKTRHFTLLDNNCFYGAKLLSHCIRAEIFDVAAALVEYHGTQLPLSYESDECTRPIYGLAHIPTAFPSGTQLNSIHHTFYKILQMPTYLDVEGKLINIKRHARRSNSDSLAGKICRLMKYILLFRQLGKYFGGVMTKDSPTMSYFNRSFTHLRQLLQTPILKLPSIQKTYEIKLNHYLVHEIVEHICQRIEKTSSESELHQWSVHDAMLQAAKYGITEFIKSMRKANPDLVWAMDKNKRGIFAHAILNRQEEVFKLIHEIDNPKGLITSTDVFGNNLLHLAAELGPSSYRGRRSITALQMQRELLWFKAVESIMPPMFREAKNGDGIKPRELFTKTHEKLVNDGRQWAKETASSFTIVGTLIITIMFAAAFTLPGGNNQDNGSPIFLGKDAFSIFIIADALSLIASSSSVLMFIGVLTSRYAEKDFIMSLPIKLLFGLLTIFLSVVFMMCAFCAALTLMLKGYQWIVITAIAFAIIPILVFMLSLLRLFSEVCVSFAKSYSLLARK